MAVIVPIEIGNVNQSFDVQLDGVTFTLRLIWQDRDESWYIDLSDASGAPLWMGQRIATGVPLLLQCRDPRRPVGEFVVIDTKGEDKDPAIDDFGLAPARVKMVYLEAADIAAAGLSGLR